MPDKKTQSIGHKDTYWKKKKKTGKPQGELQKKRYKI